MNINRKTLATAGFLAATATFTFTPAIAAADVPSMYTSCTATQEGRRITTANGDVLECVEVDTGTGYDWEAPA